MQRHVRRYSSLRGDIFSSDFCVGRIPDNAVLHDVAAGRLQVVLQDFAAPPNGIYAVFPQRKHLPLRVRLWIDFIKHSYGDPRYWTG